ncbi:MAG: exodeoxyribonuclease VII large subunit [Proteobacteria bacterium]|nr:exodeoxyribonuclease VII large subunit [Pseudomonadota bacterium]
MPAAAPRVWAVGALCHAVADALDARFNPVAVRGEISNFSRAASGHCYFSLKDETGQLRCAMFRRAAALLDFAPQEGEHVELRGRIGVYEQRGDLQLIAESLVRVGQGSLFEQFLKLKARLEAEGLFDPARKRELPPLPRGIGVVTSLDAAALHDVVTALRRRAPHVPVVVSPARVQGVDAPADLVRALTALYRLAEGGSHGGEVVAAGLQGRAPQIRIDLILLVRGGGAIEDLWAFNDETLARTIVQSPVPVVCGVGHETDFTIADFCADLRAPTPTAAAELAARPRGDWLDALQRARLRLADAARRQIESQSQRVDLAAARLARPSLTAARYRALLSELAQRLHYRTRSVLERETAELRRIEADHIAGLRRAAEAARHRLERARLRLELLDPRLVLERGYAWLSDEQGGAITRARQTHTGQALRATLADGEVDLTVSGRCRI